MSRPAAGSTRRQFTQSLAALAAAIPAWVGGGTVAASTPGRSPSGRLRIAAIGVGNRGETNLLSVAGEEVAALCDVDRRYLAERAERFPAARRYADYRELFAQERDLDAVVISTPDHTHAHATRLALRHGLHVYCEKPLVHRFDELDALLAAARRSGKVTRAGNQHHASDGYQEAVRWLKSGRLGEILATHAWTDRPFWPQGETTMSEAAGPKEERADPPAHLTWDLWLGPARARPYQSGLHPMNWRGHWDFGSGALGDRGPHLLDPLFTGLRLGEVVEIRPASAPVTPTMTPAWSVIEFDIQRPDHSKPLTLTWYDGGKQPAREITGISRLPPNGCFVVGSEARLFIPELGGKPRVLARPNGTLPSPLPPAEPSSMDHMAQWLADCREGNTTARSFLDVKPITQLVLLGNAVLRQGNRVRFEFANPGRQEPPISRSFLTSESRHGWDLTETGRSPEREHEKQ